ncbi:MAG: D-xylose ABC transporter ATP-binding protein [Opitutus sp.]|nr:D-xylose ABC transporter ATP-binding protein [Opitutus sp.]
MSAPLLEVRSLTKRFPGVVALRDVTFDLAAGEIHAICGENGAGKSTLIKLLSGIHPHGSYEGEIRVDGRAAAFASIRDAEAAGISVITQEFALVDELTVAENLFLGREPRRGWLIDWGRMHERTAELLAEFGLRLAPDTPVRELGIGQKQLLEILRALDKRSRILVLDEPTAALPEHEVGVLLDHLRRLRANGTTCIYISHKLDEVFAIADRITVLRDGESIATLATRESDVAAVIRHMVGREITELFPRHAAPTGGEVRLAVRGLSVAPERGAGAFLRDVSFELRAGEVLGIGGLMGAGRTELLMHLFGAWGHRTAGQVILSGETYAAPEPGESIARGLVLASEDRRRYGLVLDESIGFNLSLSSLGQFTRGGVIRAADEEVRNQHFFSALRIKAGDQSVAAGALSGGGQQKVVLGKALMTEPRVVMLDEPTRGIDVGAKLEVYDLINRLTRDGRAVLLVSSELPELMGMCDRILMLAEGRVGGVFARAEFSQEKLLAAAMHP